MNLVCSIACILVWCNADDDIGFVGKVACEEVTDCEYHLSPWYALNIAQGAGEVCNADYKLSKGAIFVIFSNPRYCILLYRPVNGGWVA